MTAEYTPSAIATTAETRIPQKISWTVNHIDRLIMAETSSLVRELFAEVALDRVAQPVLVLHHDRVVDAEPVLARARTPAAPSRDAAQLGARIERAPHEREEQERRDDDHRDRVQAPAV